MIEKGPIFVKPDSSRYVIEEKVAEGGMGVVYRVLDRTLGRTVAMKVCSRPAPGQSSGSSPQASDGARFLEEAHVTAQLDHPGIVPVHELGVSGDDAAYFTMPLVHGSGLGDVFALARENRDGWNLSRAVAALIKVCQAVAYAHSKGIVHRDLKPANVIVGRFGQVYVLDWGLAKVLEKKGEGAGQARPEAKLPEGAAASPPPVERIGSGSAIQTEAGTVLGTPAYMPPEQASGGSDGVDERSDVYALGAILYELLTGQPPYVPRGARIGADAILARLLEGPPQPILSAAPKAPRELAAICEKAMAREPGLRFQGAFELAEDLQAYLDHRVVSAYRTGPLAEIKAWCFRHRVLLASAAAVAIASVIALFALDRYVRLGEARQLVQAAESDVERHDALRAEIPRLQHAWLDASMAQSSFASPWERDEELRSYRSLESARKELDSRFNEAVLLLSNALRIVPASDLERKARLELKNLYLGRYRAITDGEVFQLSPRYYEGQLAELDPSASRKPLDPPGRLELATDPPGAEVYCFRYVECDDTRLEPRPFDAARGVALGEPMLRVESIVDPEKHQALFTAGDRLLEVKGAPVRTCADLAHALEGLETDARVEVLLERLGSQLRVEWIPFPGKVRSAFKAGSLRVIHEQLGLTFEGYPLDLVERSRIGVTEPGKPLSFELPKGSYLIVLRKQGYQDVRYPVAIPWRARVETVRLFELASVPAGFAYVPAGPFSYGGDLHAFQSLERGEEDLHGFFIGRLEVTVAEYLEFLNDPDVSARTDDDGTTVPLVKSVREELANFGGATRLLIVPAQPSRTVLALERRPDRTWGVSRDEKLSRIFRPTSPLAGVSQLAAREYANWRTARSGKWTFRLPADLEWEKAARGVDRRTHVWGEYLIPSFCWSSKGTRTQELPFAVGIYSTDESVYGVRDLAGSVDEHTSSRISWRDATHRGGSWSASDSQNLRIATRNGRHTNGRGTETGFRLVVELPK